jgi:enamine deaminase RidA (YjgF/YER057c/UK114 family)
MTDRPGAPPNLRFVNPPALFKIPGLTHVIEAIGPGRTVFVGGQLSLDGAGRIVGAPGDFPAQATQAFENLKTALAAVGGGMEHVVKITNYLVDVSRHFPIFRQVRDRYVSAQNPPASTLVQVSRLALDGLLFEVEAIAVLPPK